MVCLLFVSRPRDESARVCDIYVLCSNARAAI
jgi:hypothetical protein